MFSLVEKPICFEKMIICNNMFAVSNNNNENIDIHNILNNTIYSTIFKFDIYCTI